MIPVGIFAKPPRAGLVKTRLIPDLGADKAAAVYRYCLEHTLVVVADSGLDGQVFLTQESDDSLFESFDVSLQHGADLGDRMFHALRKMLGSATAGAMVIGSDCLDLRRRHLVLAAQALADHELVLIPAVDGGFALIGCTRIDPGLFQRVEWSSATVLEQTLENADQLGYRYQLLETLRDIDTLRDLEQYPELVALIASG